MSSVLPIDPHLRQTIEFWSLPIMASEVLLPPWFDCAPAWSDNQEAGGEVVNGGCDHPPNVEPDPSSGRPKPLRIALRTVRGRSPRDEHPLPRVWGPLQRQLVPGGRAASVRDVDPNRTGESLGGDMFPEQLELLPEYLDDRLLIVCEAARPLFHDVGKCRQCILDHVESLICGHNPNLHLPGWGVNRHSSHR
jgi:hypothetical protein